jgi:hypothetical protein
MSYSGGRGAHRKCVKLSAFVCSQDLDCLSVGDSLVIEELQQSILVVTEVAPQHTRNPAVDSFVSLGLANKRRHLHSTQCFQVAEGGISVTYGMAGRVWHIITHPCCLSPKELSPWSRKEQISLVSCSLQK